MTHNKRAIAVAKGDGIGAEIMEAVLHIFDKAAVPLDYQFIDMGRHIYEAGHSTGMTPEAKDAVESLGILFKGPMETPKGGGVKSINVTARKVWNTYANKRVFKTLGGVETVFSKNNIPIDITVVRENIEDTYGGIEHMLTQDVALCRRFITRPGSLQVHRYAFEMARSKKARRITCGHKANIMKLTDGLFLETFYEVANQYPDIKADDVIVDDLCMKLVTRPNEFDVVVLPNLQGDIVSDLCAGLVGGLGFAPSANIGDHVCIFEAVHGTAPDIAGKGIANPTALLLSGLMMLRHLGYTEEAATIDNALLATLEEGVRTGDFGNDKGPALGTMAFAQAIISRFGVMPLHSKPQVPFLNKPKAYLNSHPRASILIQSGSNKVQALNGADFFLEYKGQPNDLATALQQVMPGWLQLTTISNRGTQVWPSGSNLTNCVDQYRVRFEKQAGIDLQPQQIFDWCTKVDAVARICSIEMLQNIDGKRAYSLAQGQ